MKCFISSPIAGQTIALLNRQLQARGCAALKIVPALSPGEPGLHLSIDQTLGTETFRIRMRYAGRLEVSGGSGLALIFGIGKMLRTGDFANGIFSFGKWRGISAPHCALRCVYFATHFHNYYHNAPRSDIVHYVEDLALWGYNTIGVWPDKHHFDNLADKDFQVFLAHVKAILVAAKAIGMRVNLLTLTNDGYRSTPQKMRATHPGRSFYGCEVCPAAAGGMDLILRNHRDTLDYFADIALDYFTLWSYDQGGCACSACAPWGAKGMLECGRAVAEMVRQRQPGCRLIYSTWLFGHKGEKEWEGLHAALAAGKGDYIDILLAESLGAYPRYPLEHDLPGKRPIINFPEISMRLVYPWGGSGANPMPRIHADIWGQSAALCDGGLLYSEGIFEDINKALFAGFYWKRDNAFEETLREYARFELNCPDESYADWRQALDILEDNSKFAIFRQGAQEKGYDLSGRECEKIRYCEGEAWSRSDFKADATIAYKKIMAIDAKLAPWAKTAWRWRLFVLRAIIDHERQTHGRNVTEACADCFEQLRQLYYAEEGQTRHTCCPPTRKLVMNK